MDTSTSRCRDVAYQLHPFTNLGRHETEGPLVVTAGSLQDTVALCPPLVISEEETDELLRRFARALDETAAALARR